MTVERPTGKKLRDDPLPSDPTEQVPVSLDKTGKLKTPDPDLLITLLDLAMAAGNISPDAYKALMGELTDGPIGQEYDVRVPFQGTVIVKVRAIGKEEAQNTAHSMMQKVVGKHSHFGPDARFTVTSCEPPNFMMNRDFETGPVGTLNPVKDGPPLNSAPGELGAEVVREIAKKVTVSRADLGLSPYPLPGEDRIHLSADGLTQHREVFSYSGAWVPCQLGNRLMGVHIAFTQYISDPSTIIEYTVAAITTTVGVIPNQKFYLDPKLVHAQFGHTVTATVYQDGMLEYRNITNGIIHLTEAKNWIKP